jgi:hypothetical protein
MDFEISVDPDGLRGLDVVFAARLRRQLVFHERIAYDGRSVFMVVFSAAAILVFMPEQNTVVEADRPVRSGWRIRRRSA